MLANQINDSDNSEPATLKESHDKISVAENNIGGEEVLSNSSSELSETDDDRDVWSKSALTAKVRLCALEAINSLVTVSFRI